MYTNSLIKTGEYIIQILKYRPRRKKHPKFVVVLADTNPMRLLRKAKDFCDNHMK